ncbi:MAG: Gx transporter family protein [Clostridia bacterium]|nr:Gx transporter family protein [Clostridia bacterium]
MDTKRMAKLALLTCMALIIFIVEAQLPALCPVPGVKLGLANIVTVYAMFAMGPLDALLILAARILLGAVFSGRVVALLYSMAGGALCYLAMLLLRRLLSQDQIWVASVIGAVFHNIGQILVAMALTGSVALIGYLPVLLVSGMIAGLFTGLCAQKLIGHLRRTRAIK